MNQLSLSQVKDTLSRNTYHFEIISSLTSLKEIYSDIEISKLYDFIPIKIIASIEAFFRYHYKNIIDNKRYRLNLNKLSYLKNIKFDFDVLDGLQDNDITLGDYISFFIPCSKFEDINYALSNLLDINYSEQLKSNGIELSFLNQLFKVRHILCHEAVQEYTLTKEFILKWIDQSIKFLELSEKIISQTIEPNAPLTQHEMIMDAQQALDKSNEKLNDLIENIKSLKEIDETLNFNFGYMDSWNLYREAKAKDDASGFDGGTMFPLIYCTSIINTTESKIRELKLEYQHVLRKQAKMNL